MGEKKQQQKEKEKTKKQKHKHSNTPSAATKSTSDFTFKPISDVKGLRFGGQFIVKSFTIRRAKPLELLRLLSLPPVDPPPAATTTTSPAKTYRFPSTTAYLPTNFTILAHQAWHTLTLGLGTKKSKVVLFVFESEMMKSEFDSTWPVEIPLGEVNKKMIRGLRGTEMARFKFRKGCLTFYVYAVRKTGDLGFACVEDLKLILQSVIALKDFFDHTAMLAMPNQRSINYNGEIQQMGMAH